MGQALSDEEMEKVISLSKRLFNELKGELQQGIFSKEKLDKSLHKDLSSRENFYKSKGMKMPVRERLNIIKQYNGIERQAKKELPQLFKVVQRAEIKEKNRSL